jgi:pyrroloquinoline quinone biosynthesis protein B
VHDRATGRLLLIEATPAIDPQVALLHELTGTAGRGRRPVDAILLTHAHIGHYLGLAQLGREVAGAASLPVWVSRRFASFLRAHGPWRQLVEQRQIELHELEPGRPFTPIPGLTVVATRVPHRDEFSDTMAFTLCGEQRRVLFLPDIDRWERTGGLLERLLHRVDVAYLDGTFFDGRELPDRDLAEIPHPLMVDTMARLEERARAAPGSIRFLHLNHTNPALRDAELRKQIEARGFRVAERGERVEL